MPGKKTEDSVLGAGAVRAKVIPTNIVTIDERVRLKCLIPRCPDYGLCPMCPPANYSPQDFKKILNAYNLAVILQVDTAVDAGTDYFKGANTLHEIVLKGEKSAFEAGARFATGLIGGSCHICNACRNNQECPNLQKARPSMEAMGIDVFATALAAGMPIKIPATDKVVWTGLILLS